MDAIKVEVEGEDGDIIKVGKVEKLFNSQMMEVFQGKIMEEMFTHRKTQVKNLTLVNSRFALDQVLFQAVNFHQLSLT